MVGGIDLLALLCRYEVTKALVDHLGLCPLDSDLPQVLPRLLQLLPQLQYARLSLLQLQSQSIALGLQYCFTRSRRLQLTLYPKRPVLLPVSVHRHGSELLGQPRSLYLLFGKFDLNVFVL